MYDKGKIYCSVWVGTQLVASNDTGMFEHMQKEDTIYFPQGLGAAPAGTYRVIKRTWGYINSRGMKLDIHIKKERDLRLTPRYVGLSNPFEIWVFSQPSRCYMVRLKPKEKYRPNRAGLTAIFKITYHGKR